MKIYINKYNCVSSNIRYHTGIKARMDFDIVTNIYYNDIDSISKSINNELLD